jgi:integrase
MDGLNFFIKRAGGKRRNSQIRGMAYDVLMIAQHWLRRPAAELKVLRKIAKSVRPEHEGFSEATRRKLTPFRDIDNVRAFLTFPEKVLRDAQKEESISRETANRVATALWIKIAQRAPLRISNLLCTSLEHNVLRSHAGKHAKIALFYPPEVVKTNRPLEIPLSESTVKLLEIYLTKYRPALVDIPSDCLFPASNGKPKRASAMSSDMQKLMREYLGFAINPHCYRHLAAKLYLTAHPGRYHDVQLLLGHRRIETTVQYYVDLQAEEVFRHFDTMLLGLEDGGAMRTNDRRRA